VTTARTCLRWQPWIGVLESDPEPFGDFRTLYSNADSDAFDLRDQAKRNEARLSALEVRWSEACAASPLRCVLPLRGPWSIVELHAWADRTWSRT
jgi:hypothetical protein